MASKKLVSAIAWAVDYVTQPPQRPIDKSLRMSMEELQGPDGSVEAAVREARSELGLKDSDYNIAVAGARGVGKSSLINALLSLDPGHGGAPVGKSEEGGVLKLPKDYRSTTALTSKIVMWKLPGAGVGQPTDTYYFRNKLYAYDHIFLVSDRFTRVDFQVAKSAGQLAPLLTTTPFKPLTLVRTKADVALAFMLQSPTVAAHLLAEATVAAAADHAVTPTPTRRHVVEAAIRRLRGVVVASWQEGIRQVGLTIDLEASGWNIYIVSCQEFKPDADVYVRLRPNIEHADPSKYKDGAEDQDDEPLKIDEDRLYEFLSTAVRRQSLKRVATSRRSSRP